jgi:hypothetical protein
MSVQDILLSSGISIAAQGGIWWLLKSWVKVRLDESVKAEYKKLGDEYSEQLRWETRRREQAIRVADLLSLWVQHKFEAGHAPNSRLHEIQTKYWELVLWLDAPILRQVNGLLSGSTKEVKTVLVAVRKSTVDAKDQVLAEELVHFEPSPLPT